MGESSDGLFQHGCIMYIIRWTILNYTSSWMFLKRGLKLKIGHGPKSLRGAGVPWWETLMNTYKDKAISSRQWTDAPHTTTYRPTLHIIVLMGVFVFMLASYTNSIVRRRIYRIHQQERHIGSQWWRFRLSTTINTTSLCMSHLLYHISSRCPFDLSGLPMMYCNNKILC